MSKGPEYKLTTADTPLKLEQSVNAWTNSGWQPIGGVSVIVIQKPVGHNPNHEILFSQALVKARQ
jgi:hypothetical protein